MSLPILISLMKDSDLKSARLWQRKESFLTTLTAGITLYCNTQNYTRL